MEYVSGERKWVEFITSSEMLLLLFKRQSRTNKCEQTRQTVMKISAYLERKHGGIWIHIDKVIG